MSKSEASSSTTSSQPAETQSTISSDSSSITNEAEDVDLDHSEESFRNIRTLLSGDLRNPTVFDDYMSDGKTFSKESGDDQGVHDSEDIRTHVAFHLATNGIMSQKSGLYREANAEGLSVRDTVQKIDEIEGYKPRKIVQGAYSTAKLIAQLPDIVGENIEAISASHSSPVTYGEDAVMVDESAEDDSIPLVKMDPEDVEGEEIYEDAEREVYAEHQVLDETDNSQDIDQELMAYALSKGMSFQDRNGDVLFGFNEINFTTYDRENLEQLKLRERTQIEEVDDAESLEYLGAEILEQAEGLEETMKEAIDEDVEVNVYQNVIEDQDGEKILEYTEMDLQGAEYQEFQNDLYPSTVAGRATKIGIDSVMIPFRAIAAFSK